MLNEKIMLDPFDGWMYRPECLVDEVESDIRRGDLCAHPFVKLALRGRGNNCSISLASISFSEHCTYTNHSDDFIKFMFDKSLTHKIYDWSRITATMSSDGSSVDGYLIVLEESKGDTNITSETIDVLRKALMVSNLRAMKGI